MTLSNLVLSIAVSVGILILVFELVRRKKLNEEYSWLWIVTAVFLFLVSLFPPVLFWFTKLIGAALPISALFFLAVMFLLLIVLHFSTVISKLTNNQKTLAQKVAILEQKLNGNKLNK
ncbi:MAG: DUF2304 domain-containing protein [Endomicrobiales bacterium]|nr:DUF2304 domain-containing protein [Endomicrobiales bacterium]